MCCEVVFVVVNISFRDEKFITETRIYILI